MSTATPSAQRDVWTRIAIFVGVFVLTQVLMQMLLSAFLSNAPIGEIDGVLLGFLLILPGSVVPLTVAAWCAHRFPRPLPPISTQTPRGRAWPAVLLFVLGTAAVLAIIFNGTAPVAWSDSAAVASAFGSLLLSLAIAACSALPVAYALAVVLWRVLRQVMGPLGAGAAAGAVIWFAGWLPSFVGALLLAGSSQAPLGSMFGNPFDVLLSLLSSVLSGAGIGLLCQDLAGGARWILASAILLPIYALPYGARANGSVAALALGNMSQWLIVGLGLLTLVLGVLVTRRREAEVTGPLPV